MLLIFLLCAFRSGTDRYYLKKALGESVRGRDVLFYFRPENVPSLVRFYLCLWARRLVNLLLCFFPALLTLSGLFYYVLYGRASLRVSMLLFFSVLLLCANGFVYYLRLNSFLFLARYCFASGGFSKSRELFGFSYRRLEGKRGEVLRKKLGFAPWLLFCVLVFPVSFVRSYYMEEMAELASDLMDCGYLQS